jgi:ribulose-phosphate 3-epimerase
MRLSASLHAADPLRLGDAVAAVAGAVETLHVDVMDGRFAPAFGFGETLVRRLVAMGAPPVDIHLMLEAPAEWALRFARLGVRSVAFHAEAIDDPPALADALRAEGALAYLALEPETAIALVEPLLAAVDGLLLLTAPAGGGAFSPAALARLADVPAGLSVIVDGALRPEHFAAPEMARVELAVIGNALFGVGDVATRARELSARAAAIQGVPAGTAGATTPWRSGS